jgi:C4-dicarboxylate-specific signal transduction histidine kinase
MQFAAINEIVEQCVELQLSRFDRHKVELHLDLNLDVPDIFCREVQIGQIVTNLLNNAFDAVVQSDCVERWVSLTTECIEHEVKLYVTDSGPGIEDHFKSHLMEPFFTTKEFGLGMGVGLSLSRAIAQNHGGTLTLLNDTKNTCFRLSISVKPNTAESEVQLAGGEVCH